MRGKKKVCINNIQMENIIKAAQADESGDPERIGAACPKALDFVRDYEPQAEEQPGKKAKPSKLDIKVEREAGKFFFNKIKNFIPDVKKWF